MLDAIALSAVAAAPSLQLVGGAMSAPPYRCYPMLHPYVGLRRGDEVALIRKFPFKLCGYDSAAGEALQLI